MLHGKFPEVFFQNSFKIQNVYSIQFIISVVNYCSEKQNLTMEVIINVEKKCLFRTMNFDGSHIFVKRRKFNNIEIISYIEKMEIYKIMLSVKMK